MLLRADPRYFLSGHPIYVALAIADLDGSSLNLQNTPSVRRTPIRTSRLFDSCLTSLKRVSSWDLLLELRVYGLALRRLSVSVHTGG